MGSPVFLIWIVLIGAMFYFMMIRPQKRARQQQVNLLDHLQPGAQVRTTAQIMGTVVEVGDDWAIVETTPGTRIKFGKPAIVGIIMADEEEGAEDGADAPTPGGIGDVPADAGTPDATHEATHDADGLAAEADAEPEADAVPVATAKDAEPVAKP
ncbi:hypothetical protein GCM10009839_70760 [Catenulispora yoronensis]|uniref:Preprotein translocase subunit YajC n=1 Tax=Catenulispora yoronensis TaxID=450799 RepID=A0ABN2V5Z7_9ACTN